MDNSSNSLNWFEIPALDVNRSKKFYEAIFNVTMEDHQVGDNKMAFFPWTPGNGKATGSIVQSPTHKPSTEGTIIYLNANPNLDTVLARVEANGGKVTMEKMNIGDHGNIAYFVDTEGNNIGIHSVE